MTTYSQGDPRQKIQLCEICEEPTGRCEEDAIYHDGPHGPVGPLCQGCCNDADPILPEPIQ